jgi:hypothetical protein
MMVRIAKERVRGVAGLNVAEVEMDVSNDFWPRESLLEWPSIETEMIESRFVLAFTACSSG